MGRRNKSGAACNGGARAGLAGRGWIAVSVAAAGLSFWGSLARGSVVSTWTGGTSGDWSVSGNWDNNTPPRAADTAVFSTAGATSITAPTGYMGVVNGSNGITSIQIGTGGGDAQSYTFAPTVFFATGGGVTINAGVKQNQTFSGTVRSDATTAANGTASLNFTNNGSGLLSLNGGETAGNGNNTLTVNLAFAGTGNITVGASGIQERSPSRDTTNVTKSGAGTLTITGNRATSDNTNGGAYLGTTTITGGTLLQNADRGANVSGDRVGGYAVTGGASGRATLGGTGTLYLQSAQSVTASGSSSANTGIIAPGADGTVGTLGVSANDTTSGVVIGNNGELRIDFVGGSSSSDLLKIVNSSNTGVGGILDLTSTSDSLNLIGSGAGTYTIATMGGYATGVNVFNSVLINGVAAQSSDPNAANYALVHYDPNDITVDVSTTPTPEPGALGLLGMGALGLLSRRRRA